MTYIKETYYNVEIENLFYTVKTLTPVDDSTLSITSSYMILSAETAITLNSTTSISDGLFEGQTVTLRGNSDTNTITINTGSNTRLNGNITLGNNHTISLLYNGIIWVETARNNSTIGESGSSGHLVLDGSANIYSDGTGTASSLSGGANNIFLGNDSGNAVTIGSRNIFLGYQSGYKNTDSTDDIGIGYRSAGYYATYSSTSENVSIGNYAGSTLGDGVSNTFIGAWAGFNRSVGNYNTFVGYGAGSGGTSGDYNVFIGYLSGNLETIGSNKLFISNSDTSTPLIYGEFDNSILQFNGTVKAENMEPIIDDTYTLSTSVTITGTTNIETTDIIDWDLDCTGQGNPTISAGQSFLTSTGLSLSGVSVYLSTGITWVSDDNIPISAKLYTVVDGDPVTLLATSTNSVSSDDLNISPTQTTFYFSSYTLSGATNYIIDIEGNFTAQLGGFKVWGSSTNTYANGYAISTEGGGYVTKNDNDLAFDILFSTIETIETRWKSLELSKHIKIGTSDGTATDGMIRYTGTDFEGYDSSTWKSLTAGITVSNPSNNRILTSDGTSNGINAESNLTFNGSVLSITGNTIFDGTVDRSIKLEDISGSANNLYIYGSSGSTNGGSIFLRAGDGVSSYGGSIFIQAGDTTATTSGGHVYIDAGNTNSSDLLGGVVIGNNSLGDITIKIPLYIQNTTYARNINSSTHNYYDLGSGSGIITTTLSSSYETMDDGGWATLAQIFTVKKAFNLTSATLLLNRNVGLWNGDLVAKIYSVTGGTNGEPLSLLATSTNTVSIDSIEYEPDSVNFTFASYNLNSSTYYALVLDTQSSTAFSINWSGAIGVYNDGIGLKYDGSWTTSTTDFSLKLNETDTYYWKDLFVQGDVDFGGNVISSINMTTTTGALKVSNLTNTQEEDLSAANGMIIYNTTTNKFRGRVNGVWSDFTTSGDTAPISSSYWAYTPDLSSIYFSNNVAIGKNTNPTTKLDIVGDVQLDYVSGGGSQRTISISQNSVAGQNGTNLKLLSGNGVVNGGALYIGSGNSISGIGGHVYIYGGSTTSGTEGDVYIGYTGSVANGKTYVQNPIIFSSTINSDITLSGSTNSIISVVTAGSGENGNVGYKLTIRSGEGFNDGADLNLYGGYGYANGGDVYISGGKYNSTTTLYEGNVIIGQYGSSGAIVGETNIKNNLIVDGTSQFYDDVIFSKNVRVYGQSWTEIYTLTSSANIQTDCDNSNVFKLSLAHNATLKNPLNLKAGATYLWIITNTGNYDLTYEGYFKFPNGYNTDLTFNTVCILTGICESSTGPIYSNLTQNLI